jgi:hypothetical protein
MKLGCGIRWSVGWMGMVMAGLAAAGVLAAASVEADTITLNQIVGPLTEPGVVVSGSGRHFYKVCSTCPDQGSSGFDAEGGNGVASATTAFDGPFSWFASAALVGENALPELKAYAEAIQPATIGYVSASASAQGLQRYHYSGTTDGTYSITFAVDGTLFGDAEAINASVSVWSSDYNPLVEGQPHGTQLAAAFLTEIASTTVSPFDESRTLTFDIGADEDFFVVAALSAQAFWSDGGSAEGYADASKTMTAAFTGGNLAFLTPSLQTSVPEPSCGGLVLAGIGALGYRRRRAGRAGQRWAAWAASFFGAMRR